MSQAVAVQFPLPKSNFCGKSEPDNHGAPLEQSRGPRRQCAGRGSRRDRNNAQPQENPGPGWVSSLSGAAAGPSITISPSSVDTLELFTYRRARPSCTRGTEVVEPREQVGRQGKYENTLLSIQPSIVNLGGTAVT
jgi:hypothetical protein